MGGRRAVDAEWVIAQWAAGDGSGGCGRHGGNVSRTAYGWVFRNRASRARRWRRGGRVVARVFTVDRLADLTNRELDEVCGTVTVARGLAYAKQGRVVELELSDDGTDATGWVSGSNGQTYTTAVSLTPVATPSAGRLELRRWASTCSCPVGGDCKHAVAVRRRGRERQTGGRPAVGRAPAPPRPTWERALGGLLDDNDLEPEHTPVGLLIEPATSPRRDAPARAQLRMRPVVPGRARRLDPHRGVVGDLRRWLLRLRAGVVRRRAARRPHRARRRPPPLGARLRLRPDAGRHPARPPRPGWVALLRAADRAGVRLLTELRRGGHVAFAPDPAELVVDVVRTDDGAELHPRLDLPEGAAGPHHPRRAAGHRLLAARRRHPRARRAGRAARRHPPAAARPRRRRGARGRLGPLHRHPPAGAAAQGAGAGGVR